MIPEFPCRDCSMNTCPLDGEREYYEVFDQVWRDARAIGYVQTDNGPQGYFLCVGCLEKRLGRELTRADFKPLPANNPSPWLSERLNSRLGLTGPFADRELYPMFHPNALHDAVMAKYKPGQSHVEPVGAAVLIQRLDFSVREDHCNGCLEKTVQE